ncbi:zinc finger protein CONSTANS-LIKE 13 [Argentina anserina]|uniref:zinc finger protein CONSTANS-LIKE 13 n=1 Tax=Argentina anserina TaxID=57926 RepID=UPI0021764855|nr:zinc finger protein CONSTANS-LIKE 13 [Potentilla anserina]XP_050363287.1 zinc finger protein CONSTANS-LIKE 13 [Potentilla anserina]
MNGFKEEEELVQQNMGAQKQRKKRLCDYCGVSMALLYCRADSAKLCFSCDKEVHSANQLFMKHTRSQLCDACDEAPASIFCSTESFVLCQNCDWERHNLSSATVHDRRPVEGFSGNPGLNELMAFVGFENLDKKGLVFKEESNGGGGGGGFDGSGLDGSLGMSDGFSDFLVWETPSAVSLDDLIVSDPGHKFQAMGVPPLPKNRNAKCGRHKEEILSQLRVAAKFEPKMMNEDVDLNSFMSFQSPETEQHMHSGAFCTSFEQDAEPLAFPAYEAQEFEANEYGKSASPDLFLKGLKRSYLQDCSMVPDLNSNNDGIASHTSDGFGGQMTSEASSALPRVPPHECTINRESALTRYKEKKKTRRYDKHIRYESRKVRAESRTRIKGRFAKIEN